MKTYSQRKKKTVGMNSSSEQFIPSNCWSAATISKLLTAQALNTARLILSILHDVTGQCKCFCLEVRQKSRFSFFFSFLQTLFEINTNKNPPNRKPSKNQGERLAVPHDHKWVILPSIHLRTQYCCILCQFLSCSDERFCWNCPIKIRKFG